MHQFRLNVHRLAKLGLKVSDWTWNVSKQLARARLC